MNCPLVLSFLFLLQDHSSFVSLNFTSLSDMNYILYPGSLPDIQHFTLCSWTRLRLRPDSMDQFATLLSYANSDHNNQIVIVFRKETGVMVYINNDNR